MPGVTNAIGVDDSPAGCARPSRAMFASRDAVPASGVRDTAPADDHARYPLEAVSRSLKNVAK